MSRIALLTVACFLLLTGAFAQSSVRTGTDYAYFFYVTEFADPGWPDLDETGTECRKIGAELRTEYGFKDEYFANLTKAEMRAKIRQLNARHYGPDDQVLFFFSTHGQFQPASDRGYLIPADGKARDTYGDSWISYDDLGSYITLNPAEHVLLALDACYSGAFGDKWKGQPAADPRYETAMDCASEAAMALEFDSRIYFTSGGRDQRTPARSLFARRWLEFLRQGRSRGVLTTYDLRYHLGSIPDPKPEGGTFTSRHEGGKFVFVPLRACAESSSPQPQPHTGSSITATGITREPHNPGAPYRLDDLPYMVPITGGTFRMGSENGTDDEEPVHSVTLSDYRLGRYEVTVGEYLAFVKATGDNYPVWLQKGNINHVETGSNYYKEMGYSRTTTSLPIVGVSWYDAVAYCNWLSEQHGYQPVYRISGERVTAVWTNNGYRLPTEAEWEYAARDRGAAHIWAGTSSGGSLRAYSNYRSEGNYQYTAPVGNFRPNILGLHDMSGNVWEWCWDWKGSYSSQAARDPKGPNSGSVRVGRGGGWHNTAELCRAAYRSHWIPGSWRDNLGFRLARSE